MATNGDTQFAVNSVQETSAFQRTKLKQEVLPVTLSMLASSMSAITLLGNPSEVYMYGSQYWMLCLAYFIAIPITAHVFVPIFYNLKLTSLFEYVELRFRSKGLRVLCAVAYIFQMTLYLAIVLYAPSLALNAVTGLSMWISVLCIGLVSTFYTSLGGMKAVMWTDVFQACLMFSGPLAVLIKGSIDFGGFANIWRISEEGERIEFFNWDPNPLVRHNLWSLVIGGTFNFLTVFGVNQAQMQRALCSPTLRQAQLSTWINLIGLTLIIVVCGLCGLVLYAQYKDCDPLSTNRIGAQDQLLPLYVMDAITIPGIPGLFTASVFSACLSCTSAVLNSLSAVTVKDLVTHVCFPKMSDKTATLVSKMLAVGYGVICIGLAFVASQLGGIQQAGWMLFGAIGGPVLALYSMAVLYPCVNVKGAYAGFITSLVCSMWLGIGAYVYRPYVARAPFSTECLHSNVTISGNVTLDMTTSNLTAGIVTSKHDLPGYFGFYEISYMWYSAFAVLVCHVVGIPVSLLTGPEKAENLDPLLIWPIVDKLCCCLPAGMRRCLRCNVPANDDDEVNAYEVQDTKHVIDNGVIHEDLDQNKSQNRLAYSNPDYTTSAVNETTTTHM